jgi:type II secretory pathway component HofQ
MPPNQMYYNGRTGVLMVRATPRELDIVQEAIEVLSETPPQITLELLFVEITRGEADDPQLVRVNGSEEERIMTGILTERQFKAVLRQLENRPGVRMMPGPRVTTLSRRETQITAGVLDGSPVEVELLPVVRSNGYDIDLPVVIRAGAVVPEERTGQPASSESIDRRLVTSTTAVVRDGQTVVVGGLRPEDFRSTLDDANALRDHPVVGPLFRRETADTRGQLLLFVTPTIINPAGNRVQPADRLPFDPHTIPDQRPRR